MANLPISGMTPATQVKDSDQLEISQGGSTFSATKQQLAGYVNTYDISAGDQTETLPDAATYPGLTYTAIVTGGDGTFDFQWVTGDNLIRDGNVETVAHEAVQGEGVTTVIAKGGDWVTVEYEDYLSVSGATTGGNIKKTLSEMVISHTDTATVTTSTGTGTIFRNPSVIAFTFPKTFAAAPKVTPFSEHASGAPNWGSQVVAPSTTTWSGYVISATNTSTGKLGYTAREKW